MSDSIKLEGLATGQTYQVQLYTIKTMADGTVVHSANSQAFTFTTPGLAASGSKFANSNSSSDTQLAGGSIFAGNFPSGSGETYLFDDQGEPISLDSDSSGVILSQYGLGGYNNGTPEFAIDAITGKAYFAGRVQAGSLPNQVIIGKGVNPVNSPTVGTPAATKDGIYINSKNYWYSDGKWSAATTDIAGALTNKNIDNSLILPDPVNSLTSSWVGTTLNITWAWDAAGSNNNFGKNFILSLTEGSTTKYITIPISERAYSFTIDLNKSLFGFISTSITLGMIVEDTFGNKSTVVSVAGATYVPSLSSPTISVTAVNNGYSVSHVVPTNLTMDAIVIEEVESNSSVDPAIGYKVVYSALPKVSAGSTETIMITSPNTNQRWVRAKYLDSIGNTTSYSSAYVVTPRSPVTINITTPTEVTLGSISWVGNNIRIPYTLPTTNAGVKFVVILNAPNSAVGYFYFYPDVALGLNQIATISQKDLFSQFGAYFSSYTGLFQSASLTDVRTSGVSLIVPTRSDNLSSQPAPVFTLTNFPDGYTVSFDFSTTLASYAEVYEFFVNPAPLLANTIDFSDYLNAEYDSGGTSTSSSIVLKNWKSDTNQTIDPTYYAGQIITGTGIPSNTYVTSITGSGPTYTINLNNNLTSQASGNYHMQGLKYSGSGPATIYSNFYQQRYVIVAYYDDFGNRTPNSLPQIALPTNPSLSLIQSAVKVGGTSGAIYVGDYADKGARVVLGEDTTHSYSGIFAFDSSSTIGSAASTSIISQLTSGGYTFETKNAVIADWVITNNKIENTSVSLTGNTYTGLSGTGTYSFWAGASSTGTSGPTSDNQSSFWVKPSGEVQANNISIIGNGNASTNLISAGSLFTVKNNGAVTATSVDIAGKITATTGSFTGDIKIGSTGSIYSNLINPATSNGQGFILNQNGLRFNSSTTNSITTIDGSTGQFVTKSALIGGWTVTDPNITATSGSGTITLDASSARISANTTSGGNYYVGLAAPTSGSTVVFWAGNAGAASLSNAFVVTADGTLYLGGSGTALATQVSNATTTANTANTTAGTANTNATTAGNTAVNAKNTADAAALASSKFNSSGNINAGLTVSPNGYIYSGKTSYTDSTAGWYLGWNSTTPVMKIGNATDYMQWDGSALTVRGNIAATSISANASIETPTILGGRTSYNDHTNTGYFFGRSGNTPVFGIGSNTNYVEWNGSALNIRAGSGLAFLDTGATLNGAPTVAVGGIGFSSSSTGGWTTHCYPYWGGGGNYDLGIILYPWNDIRLSGTVMVGYTAGGTDAVGGATGPKTKLQASGNIYANTLGTTTTAPASGTTLVQAGGYIRVYSTASSRKYKENILYQNTPSMYNLIKDLSPVTFNFIPEYSDRPDQTHLGLIAEEVHDIQPNNDLVIYKDGKPESIAYEKIPMFLVGAFKEMSNKIDSLQTKLDELTK